MTKSQILYIFKHDIMDAKDTYKIGITSNIFQREKTYQTVLKYGRMVFAMKTTNARQSETNLKKLLAQHYTVQGEVVFGATLQELKTFVKVVTSNNEDVIDNEDTEHYVQESDDLQKDVNDLLTELQSFSCSDNYNIY